MASLQTQEFRALRDAVASRGHLRAAVALAGFGIWAALLTAALIALPFPIVSMVPLVVLVATFEIIRSLHAGAERIGRYLQVFHEESGSPDAPLAPPAWERTAMAMGRTVPGAAGHPLLAPVFALATFVNTLVILLPGPVPVELGLLLIPHAAFLLWLALADRTMRRQRTEEEAAFRKLRQASPQRP